MSGESARRRDLVDSTWELFVSVRLTLFLLAALALAVLAGTFASPDAIPLPALRARLGDGLTFTLARFLDLNDLFHSWWFTALMVALALNLVACTVDRLPQVLRLAFRPEKVLTDSLLASVRNQERLPLALSQREAAAAVQLAFAARGFKASQLELDGFVHLFAQRSAWSRLGVYVVHASLLMILAGGIIGRVWGAEGSVELAEEGGGFDAIPVSTLEGLAVTRPLGFAVVVRDFRLQSDPDGSSRPSTDVALVEDEELAGEGTVAPGEPLDFRGWLIRQAAYREKPEGRYVTIRVSDREGGEQRSVRLRGGQPLEMPDGSTFTSIEYDDDHAHSGPGLRLLRQGPDGQMAFWVFQKYPGWDLANRMDRWGIDLERIEPTYFTRLQLVRDPGSDLVFAGAVLLLLGLVQALFTSHRRLWARIAPDAILLAGGAHKNAAAFEAVFVALVDDVRRQLVSGCPPPPSPGENQAR